MTVHPLIANMTRGELSPLLHARVDTDHYQAGLALLRNWVVMRYGGVTRAPGTIFDGDCKTNNETHFIPFEFNRNQVYAIEAGENYFRFWTPDGRIESPPGTPVEVATPYASSAIPSLRLRQSGDVLYMVAKTTAGVAYHPKTLTRNSETSWTLADFNPKFGPFLPEDTQGTYFIPAARGSITPTMTSNVLPSGTAASDTGSADAWRVFDANQATWYTVLAVSGWLSYTFGGGVTKVADGYWIQADPSPDAEAPSSWTFEGYDGAAWIVLDSRNSEINWIGGERRYFSFPNETAYEAYRLNWSTSSASSALTVISELAIHERTANQTAFNLTASSTAGINGGAGWNASDVGRVIELTGSDGLRRAANIVARVSSTIVTIQIEGQALPDVSRISRWRLGAFGDVPGWPSAIAIYEDRLTFGRTAEDPLGVWSSVSGDYDNFGVSTPVVDDDAVSARLTGGKLNDISWLAEGRDILAGTAGSLRAVGRNDQARAYSPTNVRQRSETMQPSSEAEPISIENVTVFVDFYEQRLYETAFTYETEGYIARELSSLCEHLFGVGISKIAYLSHPNKMIMCLRYDGKLVAFTYDREQKVTGASLIDWADDVTVDDMIALPGSAGTDLWMIVKRTINGGTQRYVERLAEFWRNGISLSLPVYGTASYVYEGAAIDDITLSHLAGETVGVWADGRDLGDFVASGAGLISWGVEATEVVIGKRFTSRLETLRLSQIGNQDGTGLGRMVNIVGAGIDLFESAGVKYGAINDESLSELPYEAESEEDPAEAKPLLTGMYEVRVADDWKNNGQFAIETDRMYPATIRAIRLEVDGEP